MKTAVSILICTRNKADSLRMTLEAIGACEIPEVLDVELIVIDNASSDDTAAVVKACALQNAEMKYVYESRPGKGYAYNTGLRLARGSILLFTDDDVRVPKNWVAEMSRPVLQSAAQIVAGEVLFPAEHDKIVGVGGPLWPYRHIYASTEGISRTKPERVVGASMAFSRVVLEAVPMFDVELGPGALGFGDETLFSKQAIEAGFRTAFVDAAPVMHHFDLRRVSRQGMLAIAQAAGRTDAWTAWHWTHHDPNLLLIGYWRAWIGYCFRKVFLLHQWVGTPFAPAWEMGFVQSLAYYRQYQKERRRPRKYHLSTTDAPASRPVSDQGARL